MQQYQDLLIDVLLDQGFSLVEAQDLIALQDHILRERRQADLRRDSEIETQANFKPPKDAN